MHRTAGDASDGSRSIFVATVLSSPHALSGEVVWQVDAREKTLSAFGEPGYGSLLLGGSVPCVLLVEATAEATILYFYSGRTCMLRCWRRNGHRRRRSSGEGAQAPKQQQYEQQQQKQQQQQQRAHSREQRRARQPHDGARKAKKRRRSGEGRARGGGGNGSSDGLEGSRGGSYSSSADGGTSGFKEPARRSATDAAPEVAVWARGKPLAVLLSELPAAYGPALSALPKCGSHAELQRSPALLRKAYHKALLAVHPDKHVHSPPSQAALAVAIFHALSAAHAAAIAKENLAHAAC